MPSKSTEEPKQTLPVGHAEAGYVKPDLSTHEGTGTLPDSELEWHKARNEAREADVKAVEEHEDKVAKEEAKASEEATQKEHKKEQAALKGSN